MVNGGKIRTVEIWIAVITVQQYCSLVFEYQIIRLVALPTARRRILEWRSKSLSLLCIMIVHYCPKTRASQLLLYSILRRLYGYILHNEICRQKPSLYTASVSQQDIELRLDPVHHYPYLPKSYCVSPGNTPGVPRIGLDNITWLRFIIPVDKPIDSPHNLPRLASVQVFIAANVRESSTDTTISSKSREDIVEQQRMSQGSTIPLETPSASDDQCDTVGK